MTRTRLAFAVALACGLAAPAQAQDSIPWGSGEVAGWSTLIDTTIDNGCFILADFDGGTTLRLGIDPTVGNDGYLYIANNEWQSIVDGDPYQLTIQMDNSDPWDAPSTGLWLGSTPGLLLTFSDPNFIAEFATLNRIEINYGKTGLGAYSLRGTMRAVSAMLDCQEAMDAQRATVSDPFADGAKKSGKADPFAD